MRFHAAKTSILLAQSASEKRKREKKKAYGKLYPQVENKNWLILLFITLCTAFSLLF